MYIYIVNYIYIYISIYMYIYFYIFTSADPRREEGERVRGNEEKLASDSVSHGSRMPR